MFLFTIKINITLQTGDVAREMIGRLCVFEVASVVRRVRSCSFCQCTSLEIKLLLNIKLILLIYIFLQDGSLILL